MNPSKPQPGNSDQPVNPFATQPAAVPEPPKLDQPAQVPTLVDPTPAPAPQPGASENPFNNAPTPTPPATLAAAVPLVPPAQPPMAPTASQYGQPASPTGPQPFGQPASQYGNTYGGTSYNVPPKKPNNGMKIAIFVGVAVLIIVGVIVAAVMLGGDKKETKGNEDAGGQVQKQDDKEAGGSKDKSGSSGKDTITTADDLYNAYANHKPLNCTITQAGQTAEIQANDGWTDIKSKVETGNYSQNMLATEDGSLYSWREGESTGVKTSSGDTFASSMRKTTEGVTRSQFDSVDFDCESNSKIDLDPPSDVKFTSTGSSSSYDDYNYDDSSASDSYFSNDPVDATVVGPSKR